MRPVGVIPADCAATNCAEFSYWGVRQIKAPAVWTRAGVFGGTAKKGVIIDTVRRAALRSPLRALVGCKPCGRCVRRR